MNMRDYDYHMVKNYIEVESGSGDTLMTSTYLNYNHILKIKCKCGSKYEATFYEYINGFR